MEKPSFAVIGAGRVGTALGALIRQSGYPIAGVVCRTMERAEEAVARIGGGTPHTHVARGAKGAGAVLIAVPDDALVSVAAAVASGRRFRSGELLVHTSGALPADVLRVRGAEKALCLSLHPIQTIADRELGAERLSGASYGVEGDAEAISFGQELVRAIGGVPLVIKPGAKAVYHAAACVASNYLHTLIDSGLRLYAQAGIPRSDALAALLPLMEGTLANAGRLGVPWALTGPVERGDVDTVRSHLHALAALSGEEAEELEGLYRLLGLHTLRLAEEKHGQISPAHRGLRDLFQGVE